MIWGLKPASFIVGGLSLLLADRRVLSRQAADADGNALRPEPDRPRLARGAPPAARPSSASSCSSGTQPKACGTTVRNDLPSTRATYKRSVLMADTRSVYRLRAGRGAVGKVPVVGVRQRGGIVVAMPVANVKRETLSEFGLGTVAKGATVYTGEHSGYGELDRFCKIKQAPNLQEELDEMKECLTQAGYGNIFK